MKTIEPVGLSKCCHAPVKANCADEGTCFMVCEECKKPYDWKEIVSSPFGLNCDYIFCKGWGRFGKIHFDNGKEMHDECFSFYKKIKSGERTEIEELAEIKSIWYEHYLKSHRMMKERISNYFIERFGEKLTPYIKYEETHKNNSDSERRLAT